MDYKLATDNHFTDAFVYMFNNLKPNKMNYEITEEQIKELAKGNAKVKNWFPGVFETKLEIGKWYKNEDYDNLVFMSEKLKEQDLNSGFTTFAKGYGFKFTDKKEWYDDLHFSDSRVFTPATDTEVLEALTNEFAKQNPNIDFDLYVFLIYENKLELRIKGNYIKVFDNGIWTKFHTKEEAEKMLNAKII